jgi:membrane associated rhomboid family serine protease
MVFLYQLSLGKAGEEFVYRYGMVPSRFMEGLAVSGLDPATFLPFLTSMFLHGGFLHLIGNMLFLYVFGDNVEDRFGHLKYIFFYVVAGGAAALTQMLVNVQSDAPMIGASGAIAGVLGAYVLMFPQARVTALVPIFIFIQLIELPAFVFLGLWFLLQIVSGVMALGIGGDAGGVAWWAHIGGFACGVLLYRVLRKPAAVV